jgi:hypothetical protein
MTRALLALAAAGLCAAPVSAAYDRIEVVRLKGELTAGGRVLAVGDDAPAGAPLRLSSGGVAVLRFEGGAVMLKGPAVFTPKASGFSLSVGGILSVLRHSRKRWTVGTPTAVAAVRGTEFFVHVRTEGGTYICLCSGALDVTPPGKPKARPVRMKSTHHSALMFTNDNGMLSKDAAGLEEHSDEELAELRAVLGKNP